MKLAQSDCLKKSSREKTPNVQATACHSAQKQIIEVDKKQQKENPKVETSQVNVEEQIAKARKDETARIKEISSKSTITYNDDYDTFVQAPTDLEIGEQRYTIKTSGNVLET